MRAYYTYVGGHDAARAAGLMDPALARQYLAASDGELYNVVRLSNIRELRSSPATGFSDHPAGYTDITQVFVTYDVVYRHEIAAMNGANSRFIYLGRNTAGQWRILEIGTGP